MIHVLTPGGFACGVAPISSETVESTTNVMASTCSKCVQVVLSNRIPSPEVPRVRVCTWSVDSFVWVSGCGSPFEFSDGAGPFPHGFRFCPFCGAPVDVRPEDST